MDEKVIKRLAVNSVVFMILVILTAVILPKEEGNQVAADDSTVHQKEIGQEESVEQSKEETGNEAIEIKDAREKLGRQYLKIEKSVTEQLPVYTEDKYRKHQIQVKVTGLQKEIFNERSISCVNGSEEFRGILKKESEDGKIDNLMQKIQVSYEHDGDGITAFITITLDQIYAYRIYEDDYYIYIELERPHNVYKNIVVIDAGHGGKDTGSYALEGSMDEKDYNLDIVLRLKQLFDKNEDEIKVYYTREEDKKVSLTRRVDLANELQADLFLSVHCNSSDETEGNGYEVLYKKEEGVKRKLSSKQFAQIILNELGNIGLQKKRGLVKGNDIFVVRNAHMPVALVEVGFISNRQELHYLMQEQNRTQIAQRLYEGIKKGLEAGKD